jgi:hypothetical protein
MKTELVIIEIKNSEVEQKEAFQNLNANLDKNNSSIEEPSRNLDEITITQITTKAQHNLKLDIEQPPLKPDLIIDINQSHTNSQMINNMPLDAEITMESAKISPATIKEDNLTMSCPARVQVNLTIIHRPPRYLNRTICTIALLCGTFIIFRIFNFSLETSPSQDIQEKFKRSVSVTKIGLNSKRSIDRNRGKLQKKT